MQNPEACEFRFEGGASCQEHREGSSRFCLYHDPSLPKGTPDARRRIVEAVKAQKRLEGACLRGADLSNADLVGAWLVRACLDGANLERSNLEGARLYEASLRSANLFNANLRSANLKEADLEGANLLEIKIDGAKLLGTRWGKDNKVATELEGRELEKKGDLRRARVKYREAEEIYRNIWVHLTEAGLTARAGDFFYREMVARRKQKVRFSPGRMSSKVVDILCGYGEKTFRVIACAAAYVLFNSLVYFLIGIHHRDRLLLYDPTLPAFENLRHFALTLYYSMVTFTTLGYGDITPVGWSRLFAGVEAFVGGFMMALFVLVFSRKMDR